MTEDQEILLETDHDHREGPDDGCQWCQDVVAGKIESCGTCDGNGYVEVEVGSQGWQTTSQACDQCKGEGWINV